MSHHCVLIVLGIILLLAACSPDEPEFSYSDLPPGDTARGADLFAQACVQCHAIGAGQSAGPAFEAYAAIASQRVKQQSAEDYTFNSILRPSKHVVQGYSNTMPGDYAETLSQQEIADLIAYLLAL